MDDRRAFDHRVRRASHACKTPLQIALSEIELLELLGKSAAASDFRQALPELKDDIRRASTEFTVILAGSVEPRKTVDLKTIVAGLVAEMEPIAARSNIRLLYDKPAGAVPVEVGEFDTRVALRNLLDNAIKYSWKDKEVRLALSIVRACSAILTISNYGIGIPEERLSDITGFGVRGNVEDAKAEKAGRVRTGSGVGLPDAIEEIEKCGGSFDIDSVPADEGPREPYHRYVTTVTVALPLVRGGNKE
jgi:signal transduction histidine kinase